MPKSTPAPSEDLVRQVRNALAHLYDYAYLQNHPLAALVDGASSLDQVTRAQRLRRLMLDCIEALRPQSQEVASSDAARAHALLTYRYVDGVPIEEIAARRSLSERQAYRELEKGVEAVASLLHEQMTARTGEAASAAPADPLQAARAEAERLNAEPSGEPIDLYDVLSGAQALLAPLSERTGTRIVLATPPPWPPVIGDRVMLRQAFLNLLTHALHSVSVGEVSLTASAEEGQVAVNIRTTMSSTGMRTHPTADGPAELGFAVAQALTEAQGGRLEPCQGDGPWATRVLLPAAHPTTVLVIDDNQDLVSLLQRYLAGHALKVVSANAGDHALRLARELQPQLITLDVMLPAMDGWEILQRLKAMPETAHIPVVICSVLHERDLAQTLGASDYLTKPVQQADLIEVLRRWLGPPLPGR